MWDDPGNWPGRRGVTLLELLVVIAFVGLLLAVTLPAVQSARESSRRSQCQNNLRQLGLALQNYEGALSSFPSGQCVGSYTDLPDVATQHLGNSRIYANAFAMLLPYLEQTGLGLRYDFEQPWDNQPLGVVDQVIPVLVCPSNATNENPAQFRGMQGFFGVGNKGGLTDYIFSKGVTDAWCLFPGLIRRDERGMFDASGPRELPFPGVSFACRTSMVFDGVSNTFCMGEGAGGHHWPLCKGPRCGEAVPDSYSNTWLGQAANNAWAAQPSYDEFSEIGLLFAGVFGSTIERLNKTPVTHTVVSAGTLKNLLNCGTSFDWRGDGSPVGPHQTSNFRSDHAHGASFLMADGSVRFVAESIDLAAYREMSTIAGSRPGEDPQMPIIVIP